MKPAIRYFVLIVLSLVLYPGCGALSRDNGKSGPARIIIAGRGVSMSVPRGKMPEKGWPVIILLHGRGGDGSSFFKDGPPHDGSGDFPLLPPIRIDHVVLAPDAGRIGTGNVRDWTPRLRTPERSKDLAFFQTLFEWIEKSRDPRMDPDRVFVAGFSNGGFMAARLARVFPDKIRALAVVAAGNPDSYQDARLKSMRKHGFSDQHPPTLVIHGENDEKVPLAVPMQYHADLRKAGAKTRLLTSKASGHEWPTRFDEDIVRWFLEADSSGSSGEKEIRYRATLGMAESGKTISLGEGDLFRVELKGVPTAGYSWKIMEMDRSVLEIAGRDSKSLTPGNMVGGSALFTWNFRASGPGETVLEMKHFRPWEGPEKATDTFRIKVVVKTPD